MISKSLKETFPKGRKECGLANMSTDSAVSSDHEGLIYTLSLHIKNLQNALGDSFSSHIPLAWFVSVLVALVQNTEAHMSTFWTSSDVSVVKNSSFMFGNYEGGEYTAFNNRMKTVESRVKLICMCGVPLHSLRSPLLIISPLLIS